MSETYTEIVTLEKLVCGECGMTFAVPSHWLKVRRDDGEHGGSFFCPNGHSRIFRESEADRLRKKLVEANCEALRQKQARAAAEEAYFKEQNAKNRLAKRVRNGVCPCCNRTFSNLARHMQTKHPEKSK